MEVRAERLAPDVARWLTCDGLAVVQQVTGALDAGDSDLAVAARLRDHGLEHERRNAVLGAATARRRARERWTDAERLLFTPSGLEQASDPAVSQWRARRYREGGLVVDVGAGIGGDTMALARHVDTVVAVDPDLARLHLLRHNVAAVNLPSVAAVAAAVPNLPLRHLSLVHADPSRRSDGRRARTLGEYRPTPEQILATVRAEGHGIVLSPAVALDDPGLPTDGEVEFIQRGDELVEAMLWTGALRQARATATIVPATTGELVTLSRSEHPDPLPVGDPGEWLVEVAPAAVRARLHDGLGAEIGARRLAARRALLTTDTLPDASPWWTVRRVAAVLPVRPKHLRRWLTDHLDAPLELRLHGMQGHVDRWWRDLGSPTTGPGGWQLHLVRLDSGATAIVTEPPRSTATNR